MMKKYLAVAAAMFTVATAQAALVGRDINGHAVIARDSQGVLDSSAVFLYDTTLNITWLRDANAAANNPRYNTNAAAGTMTWDQATSWASSLNVGGFTGWRLPTVTPDAILTSGNVGTEYGYNVRTKSGNPTQYEAGQAVYSEMAHLWYVTLGNIAYCAPLPQNCNDQPSGQPGWGLSNIGDFQNLLNRGNGLTWTDSTNAQYPSEHWAFNLYYGEQAPLSDGNAVYAFAVRAGDVAPVPLPCATWLMVSGIGALGVAARRREHSSANA